MVTTAAATQCRAALLARRAAGSAEPTGPGAPGPDGHAAACIGETMAALVPAGLEPLESASTLRIDVAGAESNVAMYLADHGVRARWVSRLGDDAFGRRVARTVGAAGVDVSGVTFDPARPTGLLFKDPQPSARWARRHPRDLLPPRLGRVRDGTAPAGRRALRTANLWHLTGITPALSASCRALARAALDVTRAADGPRPAVSFDVNYRARAVGRAARRPAARTRRRRRHRVRRP